MSTNKLKMANHVAGSNFAEYENVIDYIYENLYSLVLKSPTKIFILGICGRYAVPNLALDVLKAVVIDAMQADGFEVTFKDRDWDNLKIVDNPNVYGKHKYEINTDKTYMSEFFEL